MKFRPLLFSLSLFIFLLNGLLIPSVYAQSGDFLYGDQLPDAPELSARGEFNVGPLLLREDPIEMRRLLLVVNFL